MIVKLNFPATLFACALVTLMMTGQTEGRMKEVDSATDQANWQEQLLKAKKVVFLGDSNTHSGEYVNQLEAMLLKHLASKDAELKSLPELINLGLSSETCCGLSEPIHPFPRPDVHERLERMLEKVQPDFVFACYGMNDGIYHPFDEERFKAFQTGVNKLIEAHEGQQVPLVLLTPPPFDPEPLRSKGKLVEKDADEFSWKTVYKNYDTEVMKRYAEWMLTIDNENVLVIDVRTPIEEFVVEKRKGDPKFAISNDGVHFDQAGHEIMAKAVWTGLGFELMEPKQTDIPLLKQIRQSRKVNHLSWLTEVGHKRPGIKEGVSRKEAIELCAPVRQKIIELLK